MFECAQALISSRPNSTEDLAIRVVATLRRTDDGLWGARCPELGIDVAGPTRDACVEALERRVIELGARPGDEPVTVVVETGADLVGVAEAAAILGWDKRRVSTYIARGTFPAPVQILASGRIWLREDVERFAADWRARRERRLRPA